MSKNFKEFLKEELKETWLGVLIMLIVGIFLWPMFVVVGLYIHEVYSRYIEGGKR